MQWGAPAFLHLGIKTFSCASLNHFTHSFRCGSTFPFRPYAAIPPRTSPPHPVVLISLSS